MHDREVKSLSVASPARLVHILRSQREQILPLSRLDVKIPIFRGYCPSCKFMKVDTYDIHCLLVIACTLPITSAEAERSFLLLRRIKTYTRSTLAEQHFSDLGVIAMNYGERVQVDDVCHALVQTHPRRLFRDSLFAD